MEVDLFEIFDKYGFDKKLLTSGEWSITPSGIRISYGTKEFHYDPRGDSISYTDEHRSIVIIAPAKKLKGVDLK